MRTRWLSVGLLSLLSGCTEGHPVVPAPMPSAMPSASATASAFVEPPEASPPPPRTGKQRPTEHGAVLDGRVVARHVDGAFEIIEVSLPQGAAIDGSGLEVSIDEGAPPGTLAVVSVRDYRSTEPTLILRRPKADEGKPLAGKIHTAAGASSPGHRHHFRVAASSGGHTDAGLVARWVQAVGRRLDPYGGGHGAFGAFASRRMSEAFLPPPVAPRGARAGGRREAPADPGDLVVAMETFSGVASVQEAMQSRRPLLFAPAGKRSVAVASLKGPALARHPWDDMHKALGKAAPDEPLAAFVPADGWYLRARELRALFRLVDEIDDWGTPLAQVIEERGEDRAVAARYEAELGIGRGPLTRAFGPDVVADLAATGSDPYVKEGSDLTLVFRVKSKMAFDTALGSTLAVHGAAHGGLDTSAFTHEGVEVRVARSRDAAVRQHRATVGDLELVSNSAGGLRRVLSTIAKKRPALAGEADFRYMLARDAGVTADVLAFAGDRFIAEVSGPRQKIAEARRQIALAELQTPAFAALLYGLLHARSPETTDELVKSKLLSPRELEHGPKDPIAFRPGEAPRSSWGTPAALTPLVDLPDVTDVTVGEKAAYERFATMYRASWSEYIDPVALRLALDGGSITADLRVLPVVDSSSYRELGDKVGRARVRVPALASGARAVIALGPNAQLRRELSATVGRVPGLGEIGLDWMGEWAMLGVSDRPSLLGAPARSLFGGLERPKTSRDDESPVGVELLAVLDMPLYAEIHLKSPAAAAIALVGLRKMAHDAAPGMFDWGEHGEHRGTPIVRVNVHGGIPFVGEVPKGTGLFYAVHGDVLIVALREGTLRGLIDDRIAGIGPKAAPLDGSGAPQHLLEGASKAGGPLATLLSWALESAALRGHPRSRGFAWTLLRGAPERAKDPAATRALAFAYFGAAPLSPDGGSYSLAEDGVHDAHRGSLHAPEFPPVPVPGSPVDKTLKALAGLRIETSFDDEPRVGDAEPAQSLHATVKLTARREPSEGR